ncbi:helix-turn-helix domain-containing protein [Natronorubrum texcoconense]|uniref:Sugar-specific transcriptional regulator TrmB n=1 Tax=Natronorubrum texcoconense TaxID=1095776 RepID=A0A1G9DWL0_9EURY|nr:helix-turn-helix domain-containing protein [Natronorubrum texcoconense]SDK68254.1 Sugar-specific transcriptional regulator TrmB [Natronorubrum texcoconense]
MASDDTDEHRVDDGSDEQHRDETGEAYDLTDVDVFVNDESDGDGVRTAAVEEVDQRIVDLLSWILDTETRAKIYVHLLATPGSTSEEVAQGTGLYPSTVREALAELHDEDRVTREKRASEGAGNNPYEYTAIQPSELVGGVVDQVQQELNTIFTLDRVLDRHEASDSDLERDAEPVTITVDDTESPEVGSLGDTRDKEDDDEPSAAEEADVELLEDDDESSADD